MIRDPQNRCVVPLLLIAVFAPVVALAGESVELARGVAPLNPRQPQVAVDAKGAIHVIFGVGDFIHYRRSDDGGKTFSDAVELPAVPSMSLGMRRGPRIAVTDTSQCVAAIGGKQGKGRDGDLLAMKSLDGGKSWSAAVQVNDAANSAREGLHAMAAGPGDSLCCTWLDLRNGKTEIMASSSTDGEATWSRNVLVYRSPDGSVCECCHPSVAIDEHGRVYVQWRNSLGGARDIYVASSSDGGRTFGKATKVGNGSWPLDACPMDGGSIAVADGQLASAWRSEKSVYLLVAGQSEERRIGAGEQPWIAMTNVGPFVVWLRQRSDLAYILNPRSETPRELAAHASDPVIACGPNGLGPVVVVWESRDGKSNTIHCEVVEE